MKLKNKKFLALSLAGMGILSTLSIVSAQTTSAPPSIKAMHNQAFSAIKQAINNNDYQAFLSAVKNVNPTNTMSTITETQFNVIVAANKLRVAGDMTGAKKLLDDAGIKFPEFGGVQGKHGMKGKEMKNLTDVQKTALSQAKDLFKEGKDAEAKALLDSAGIKSPEKSKAKKISKIWNKITHPKTGTTTQ